jgi:hypothetical protein
MLYGYWILKFIGARDGLLDIWEYDPTLTEVVDGAHLALTYWRDQHEVCSSVGAVFTPPKPDQLVAVARSVFEGHPVKGVRYPSPEHMSGWWLVTNQSDGNAKSLQTEHLHHLTSRRPDLARYLALPFGFRFDSNGEDSWFDSDVVDG